MGNTLVTTHFGLLNMEGCLGCKIMNQKKIIIIIIIMMVYSKYSKIAP